MEVILIIWGGTSYGYSIYLRTTYLYIHVNKCRPLISNTSVNCSTLNTHQRHRHLASIMPPPRGWREGRAPPSSRPGLEIEEFKEFMRMKLYYWLMLKRQFQPDKDQRYKICELRYFFWDASRNQKVWSDAQIKNVRGKGTSYDRSFLTLSRRAGGGGRGVSFSS